MDMDQRESNDGCLKYEGVPTDGFSQLYVGDIDIRFKNFLQAKIPLNMKMETL